MPLVLLQHGGLDNLTGKTGLAMLRHRKGPIVAVIDPAHAGEQLEQVTGIARSVPIVENLQQALLFAPQAAVVGLAPSGGRLPDPLRMDAIAALQAGLHLASGLHSLLEEDPELAASRRPECWIWDLRQEPPELRVGQGCAATLACQRVLAVGTDMAVGKMSVCLELLAAAEHCSHPARFIGTGQAGILISGDGVALDAVRVDYAAGAVEAAVMRAGEGLPDHGLILVEGQGSLCHPGSTATLPLLRGSQPTELVLVHRAGQTSIDRVAGFPLPSLGEVVMITETIAAMARPASAGPAPRVRAIALNTARLDDTDAQEAVERTADELGLPCSDPVRWGGQSLLRTLLDQ